MTEGSLFYFFFIELLHLAEFPRVSEFPRLSPVVD